MWTAERYLKPPEKLATWEQVRSAILHLTGEPDPSLLLHDDTGASLIVGVRDNQAFVVHHPRLHSPAVSASLDPSFQPRADADYVDFTVGGTRTPIPKDRCIPLQTLLGILEEYWKDRHLSRSVSWVQD